MNILLTNTGRRTYLINFFLKTCLKYKIKIFISDPSNLAPTFYLNKKITSLVSPKSENYSKYLSFIKKTVQKKKIKCIIPISDYELKLLGDQRYYFENLGVKVLISKKNVIKNCTNKVELAKFCRKNKLNYPKIFKNKKEYKFPMIIKKIEGFGSKGLKLVLKKNELIAFDKKFFAQEFINGKEYGVDILNDLNGNYIDCTIKEKILMRAGETDKSKIIYNNAIVKFSKKISNSLKHIGNLDLDIIIKKKKIFIIDINPRFGGGYPATHLSGKNYIEYLIRDLKGLKNKKFFTKAKKITVMKGISLYSTKSKSYE